MDEREKVHLQQLNSTWLSFTSCTIFLLPCNLYSHTRLWQRWSNFHVVDNAQISLTTKIKPVLDVLERTFFNYSSGQELSVDEAMVKYMSGGDVVATCVPFKFMR